MLEEAVRLMRSLWRGELTSFQDSLFDFYEREVLPVAATLDAEHVSA